MKVVNLPSPNFNERHCAIDSIIIHYTDMVSTDEALKWLCNPASRVSAHYLIDEGGQIHQLVDEDKRAWHAGESFWQGRSDLNGCSIGIELANPGHSFGYRTFPEAQIDALVSLCEGIRSRWGIVASRILGHSDVAPRRKQDPGHLFPWERLAKAGMGLWPASHPNAPPDSESIAKQSRNAAADCFATLAMTPFLLCSETYILNSLAQIGYETTSPLDALLAFQRHFQPQKVDGVADNETYALIQGLLRSQEELI